MTLPTTLKEPSNNLSDYSLIIAGEKKVGKSSWATQFPNHYMIECEPGNALHLKANYDDVFSWEDILTKTKELEAVQPKYCKTLIIDDVPSAYDYCLNYTRKICGVDKIEKDDFDIWRTIGKEFRDWVLRLRQIKAGLIFTCHTDIKTWVDTVTNRTTYKLETTMTGQLNKIMESIGVLWGVMLMREDGNRSMVIQGNSFIKAGNGFTNHFLWEGKQLSEIPLGTSPEQGYTNFLLAFNNALQPQQNLSVLKPGGKVELLMPKKAGA